MPEAIREYLQEASELYSLTGPELENLLSVVVREPGFPKLVRFVPFFFVVRMFGTADWIEWLLLRQLEKLDSMWVIQGIIQAKGQWARCLGRLIKVATHSALSSHVQGLYYNLKSENSPKWPAGIFVVMPLARSSRRGWYNKLHMDRSGFFQLSLFVLNNVAEIKLAVATLHRDALLCHDRSDKLCRGNVKTGVIDPIQSLGSNHDGCLRPVALSIKGRRIQRAADDARFQWRTVFDGNALGARLAWWCKTTNK
jgi:hypothetical protein